VLHQAWQGKLSTLGFEEFLYTTDNQLQLDSIEQEAEMFLELKMIGPYSEMDKIAAEVAYFESGVYERNLKPQDDAIRRAIETFRPDAIVVDDHSVPPAVYYSGLPWIKSISVAPLFEMFEPDLPPGGSGKLKKIICYNRNRKTNSPFTGLPLDGNRTEWPQYNKLRRQLFYSPQFNDTIQQWGYARYPQDTKYPQNQILTLYATPEELNYPQIRAKGWHNLEAFNLCQSITPKRLDEIVPEDFVADDLNGEWSGKWIYLSMGSLASVDLQLMKRLVRALAPTKHKFVVSKGPKHEQLDLPANMWGKKYQPQMSLLPHMDMVITHGGNNTFTETFAAGKKMLVLPLCSDQFDNAQRLQELRLGARLDYCFKDEELTRAIDLLLHDDRLGVRLQEASRRIHNAKAHEQLVDKIEGLLSRK